MPPSCRYWTSGTHGLYRVPAGGKLSEGERWNGTEWVWDGGQRILGDGIGGWTDLEEVTPEDAEQRFPAAFD